MSKHGVVLTEQNVQLIVNLLSNMELTFPEIAERMGYERAVVIAINRKFQVRRYTGVRNGVRSEASLQKTS